MKPSLSCVALALVTLLAACGGDDDDAVTVDGGNVVDSAVVMPDSSSMTATNTYALNGATTAATPSCMADIMAGSNADRTGVQFVFKAAATAGTYTVEPGATRTSRPVAAMGVVFSYLSAPVGGTKIEQMGQSGTITLDLVGGKLHVVAVNIPSKELTTMAAATISANLTCP